MMSLSIMSIGVHSTQPSNNNSMNVQFCGVSLVLLLLFFFGVCRTNFCRFLCHKKNKRNNEEACLWGIIGHAGSGKDTIGKYLIENYGFEKDSFAGPLKKGVQALFDFTDDQLEDRILKETVDIRWGISPREAFNFVGTELIRDHMGELMPDVGRDFLVRSMDHRLKGYKENRRRIVVTDVRNQNEAEFILRCDGRLIRVDRPNLKDLPPRTQNHSSVKGIDAINPSLIDVRVQNDGSIDDLETKIKALFFQERAMHSIGGLGSNDDDNNKPKKQKKSRKASF